MKSLTVILENKLHFSADALKQLSKTAHIGLQKLLSYPNSKYLENEKYGYSNYNVPSHLYTYHIDRDRFNVYRGEFTRMSNYLLKFDIKIILVDKTVISEDMDFSQSNTVLREDQNEFLNALLPFNEGIGLAYTSFGKCFCYASNILMFDGSLKEVQDITKGDLVMGIDSTPRTVQTPCIGRGEMFEIQPVYGDTFTVNGEHILSLQATNHVLQTKLRSGEIVEVTVNDYLKYPKWKKHILKLRRPEEITFPKAKEPTFDPYIIGIWLADGDIKGPKLTIANEDVEIISSVVNFAKHNNFNLVESLSATSKKCKYYNLTTTGGQENPIRTHIRTLILKDEKHISSEYKLSSKENRLELLAGLLDGDGHLIRGGNKTFEILIKGNQMAKDVRFIAQSLGLKCTTRTKQTHYVKDGVRHDCGPCNRLFISGPTHIIPTKVKRKQSPERGTLKSHLTTGFKIKPVGVDDYYGFTLDGDKLFMTDDFIIHHNTITVMEWIRILKQRTLILVHTTFLQKQWIEEMTNSKLFNIDKKRIGGAGGCFGGKKFRIGDINVSLYHSAKKDKIISEYRKAGIGAIFVDEVQKAVIDDIQKVVNNLPSRYKFGVTAGIKRKDGKEFMVHACIGPTRYEAIETASDSKILANITFEQTSYENEDYEEDNNYTALINDMALDRERNIKICQLGIQRVKQHGDLVIIFVERVIQAGILAKYLSKFRVELLLGPTNLKKIRENEDMLTRVPKGTLDILEKYDYKTAYERVKELGNKKQLDFIIGTQKMEVGLSIRPVTFGILTTPAGNNLERFNQILGRLERTFSELMEKLFGGKKNIPIMAVMVDKTRVSQNAKYSIESKYEDRILSARKKRPKDKAKAITRRRPKVEVPKVKVKRKEIDYKSSKPKVRVRRTITKE